MLETLKKAAQDLFAAKFLWLSIWPLALSIIFWTSVFYIFAGDWNVSINHFYSDTWIDDLGETNGLHWLTAYLGFFLLFLLWMPAVYITSLLIVAFFIMPLIMKHVSQNHYPELEQYSGGTFIGSIFNTVITMIIYLFLWLLLLPFWFFLPLGFVITLFLSAWVNKRLFAYEALCDYASKNELSTLRKDGFWLSALLGSIYFIPFLNLFASVFMGLAFAHHYLKLLSMHRQSSNERAR